MKHQHLINPRVSESEASSLNPRGYSIRTFFKKFRRRRKSSLICFIMFTLLSILITASPVHSFPFQLDSGHQSAVEANCEFSYCFNGSKNPGEQFGSLPSLSCPQLKSLHQCLKSLATNCRGVLAFHTLSTMVKNSKRRCRADPKSGSSEMFSTTAKVEAHSRHHRHHAPSNRHQQHQQSPPEPIAPTLRSGDMLNVFQQLSKPGSSSLPSSAPPSHDQEDPSELNRVSLRDHYCMAAAYNFTVGLPRVSNSQYASASKVATSMIANPEEHVPHLYKSGQFHNLIKARASSFHHVPSYLEEDGMYDRPEPRAPGRKKSRKERAKRDTSALATSSEYVKSANEAVRRYLRSSKGLRMNSSQTASESSSGGDLQTLLNQRQSRDISSVDESDLSVPLMTEQIYKEVQPMTPSLTCIIFGDPHIRTFDSRYQTCNCLGARSLIEHPLFDVQITSSRLHDQFNATGVTKVTVIVHNFTECFIANDLIYETDSITQDLPSATFTDGSTKPNSMISIKTYSEQSVVTISLDHIGVRIYISQFAHTKFLNVVIKLRTATSKIVKKNLVLDAISSISLCKSGCHPRELVNLESVLKNAGIDTTPPAKGTTGQEVKKGQTVDVDEDDSYGSEEGDNEDDGNYEEDEDAESAGSDEYSPHHQKDLNNRGHNNKNNNNNKNQGDYYDEDDDDADYEEGEDDYSDVDLQQPKVPPRGKRVKKDSDTDSPASSNSTTRNRNRGNKNRNREGKGKKKDRKNRKNKNNQQNLESTTPEPKIVETKAPKTSLSAIFKQSQVFQQLRPSPPGSSALHSSKSASVPILAPPVQLHLLPSFSSSSSTASPSISEPELSDGIHDLGVIPTPSLTDECNEMKAYYRLTCLYDTVLKGIPNTFTHKFASSFDEPRALDQIETAHNETKTSSGSSSSALTSTTLSYPLLLMMVMFSWIMCTKL